MVDWQLTKLDVKLTYKTITMAIDPNNVILDNCDKYIEINFKAFPRLL